MSDLAPLEQTKFSIPFSVDSPGAESGSGATQGSVGEVVDQQIVGILAHRLPLTSLGPDKPKRPIALILHGVLSHKDQIYHKTLVRKLHIDSFRFDFRANYETRGEWNMANFYDDLDDMRCVILHLRRTYNYEVQVIVGHSRGALDGWTYFSRFRDLMEAGTEEHIPYYVSVAGRWRMERIHDRDPVYKPAFEKEGFYRWRVKVAGNEIEVRIKPEDVEAFAKFPIAEHVRRFPQNSDCLLVHGTVDPTVPTPDLGYYINTLTSQGRRPGSCQMHLVEKADHNFRGHYDEVADTIVAWLHQRQAIANGAMANAASASSLPGSSSDAATTTTTGTTGAENLESSWSASVAVAAREGKGKL